MSKVSFEIVEHIAVLHEGKWTKELNLVSWNGKEPKYDIRDWNEDHSQCGKGITLTNWEIDELVRAMNERNEA